MFITILMFAFPLMLIILGVYFLYFRNELSTFFGPSSNAVLLMFSVLLFLLGILGLVLVALNYIGYMLIWMLVVVLIIIFMLFVLYFLMKYHTRNK